MEPIDGERTVTRWLFTFALRAALGATTVAFTVADRRARVAIAAGVGAYATITGAGLTAVHAVKLRVSGSDWTGIPVLLIGGLALLGLGTVLLVGSVHRRFWRLLAVPVRGCASRATSSSRSPTPSTSPPTADPAVRGHARQPGRGLSPTSAFAHPTVNNSRAGTSPHTTAPAVVVLHGSDSNR